MRLVRDMAGSVRIYSWLSTEEVAKKQVDRQVYTVERPDYWHPVESGSNIVSPRIIRCRELTYVQKAKDLVSLKWKEKNDTFGIIEAKKASIPYK